MEIVDLILEIVGVSASGVLAPGPMFFANLLYSSRQGPGAGLKMAYGHTIVELPLIVMIAVGIFSASAILSTFNDIIGIVGGVAILGFAGLQVIAITRPKHRRLAASPSSRGPFTAGILLSAVNPFFLIWWLTIGVKLISDSLSFGILAGVGLVFGLHIWMDYAWLIATAYVSSKGARYLSSKYYTVLVIGLIGILVYFGIIFLYSALT